MATKKRATLWRGTTANVARLARALKAGELVAVPTETVYGLAGNALSAEACQAIFKAKGRPSHDPLIVHVHALKQLDVLAVRNPAVDRLAKAFWPGPLTLVLPKKNVVPDIVTSGRDSVAVRMPAHPLFRRLLRTCQLPLAAPSANPFSYISPTTAQHVLEGLGDRIKHILDGGPCRIGLESTILDLRDPAHPVLLRPGAIEKRALERVLKCRVTVAKKKPAAAREGEVAPGMLHKHYSPRTPLSLSSKLSLQTLRRLPADEAALLIRRPARVSASEPNLFWLSETGALEEAARNLFSQLRRMDRGGWARLHAERAPGKSGLADAINDRLTRAAARD